MFLRGGEKRRRGKESVCILIHTVHWYMAACPYHELTWASVIRNDVFIHVYMHGNSCKYMLSSHGYRPSPALMLLHNIMQL